MLIPPCVDCGEVRVIHPLEKAISWFEARYERPSERRVAQKLLRAQKRFKHVCMLSRYISFSRVYTSGEHTKDTRVRALFEGAHVSPYELYDWYLFGEHQGFFIRLKRDHHVVHRFKTMPHELLPYSSPVQLDDKYELIQFLKKSDVPVPETWTAVEESELAHISVPSGGALVTKPRMGTRGRHTTLHIHTKEELLRAFRNAKIISTRVVVQHEVRGVVHRISVIHGKDVYVARREYPYIVGDGVRSIAQLVHDENMNPLRDGIYFMKIPFGQYQESFLKAHGRSGSDVLRVGERCVVHDKNSRRNGTITEDLTDQMHPSIRDTMRRAAQVLRSPAIGFDVVLEDIAKPVDEQEFGIIESNSVPYLDVHHFPYVGKKHIATKALFDAVAELQGDSR